MSIIEKIHHLKNRSIGIIHETQTPTGAYLASPTFPVYQYSWFRDGSFIADAMSRVGQTESTEKFFDWASKIILDRKDDVYSGKVLHTRYTSDGKESGDIEWSNFQTDGFGTLIWAMHMHAKRHNRSLDQWREAINVTIEYLARHWKEPCHDWWEERLDIHPATLASIYAAFKLENHPDAEAVKRFVNLKNAKLDASLLVCSTPFELINHKEFSPILLAIEEKLVTPGGGVFRHETDTYYGGGEWMLLTCFLGCHYAALGRTDEAMKKLERVALHADTDGLLPEQSQEFMLAPEYYDYWVRKWGPPPHPLLWSHAMFLTLSSVLHE